MITRRLLLLALVAAAIIAGHGCAFTDYNRFLDRVDAAQRDLSSPAMTARICAAGADTPECRK